MSISQLHVEVKDLADVFSPGEEDRAMLRSNLSASSGPSGVSTPAFVLPNSPGGYKAINLGGEAEGEGASPLPGSTSLDNSKHLGIFPSPVSPLLDNSKHPPRDEHPRWKQDRERFAEAQERVAVALDGAGRREEASRVRNCCQTFRAYKAYCCGDTIAFPYSCGHRLCPLCMRRRSAFLRDRILHDFLPKMKHPVHIVLTVENVEHIDKDYFSWLRNCFTKLRHRKVFEECSGGVYSIETSYNLEVGTWHVHLHVLADVPWIDQGDLSRVWERITGSCVVWISAVGFRGSQTLAEAAKEIAKYIVKPGEFLLDSDLVDEYLTAVRSMRLLQPFGDLLDVKSEEEPYRPECWCGRNVWILLGNFLLCDIYRDESGCYRCRPGSARSP